MCTHIRLITLRVQKTLSIKTHKSISQKDITSSMLICKNERFYKEEGMSKYNYLSPFFYVIKYAIVNKYIIFAE